MMQGRPGPILAIQKEMFRDHFFFDKMEKVELEPLEPQQMVEAYRKRFKALAPFTEDALFTLARVSRGIFRRFLRYITLALGHWEIDGKGLIDTAIVKQAVTVERLAEDMELELAELFPKQSDLRLQVIRLLMHLEESGPRSQTELADENWIGSLGALAGLWAEVKLGFFPLGSRSLISARSGVVQFRPALACRSRIFPHHILEYLPGFPSHRRAAVSGGRVRYAWERDL